MEGGTAAGGPGAIWQGKVGEVKGGYQQFLSFPSVFQQFPIFLITDIGVDFVSFPEPELCRDAATWANVPQNMDQAWPLLFTMLVLERCSPLGRCWPPVCQKCFVLAFLLGVLSCVPPLDPVYNEYL